MAKHGLVLGEYTPYGHEMLGHPQEGTACSSHHQLVASERDGVIAEEELYIAGDGRVAWSSGRQAVRGFKAPSRAIQAFFCRFSGLNRSLGGASSSNRDLGQSYAGSGGGIEAGSGDARSGEEVGRSLSSTNSDRERCLAILEPGHLMVHAPGGAELPVHVPFNAVRAWPLTDGVLILVRSSQGSYHAVSVVAHPLNLPRCVSYINVGTNLVGNDTAGQSGVSIWKDVLPLSGATSPLSVAGSGVQLRWVCPQLPLAVGFLPCGNDSGSTDSSRVGKHVIMFLRRRAHSPGVTQLESRQSKHAAAKHGGETVGMTASGTSIFETQAICKEPSEIFLQQLWTFPEDGPPCDPDDVFLLAPESEFARDCVSGAAQGAELASPCGLLLALFVRSTQRMSVVRLWSWEILVSLSRCLSVVALLPGDDIRARTTCASGLASFPSRWYGSRHCRIVLQEEQKDVGSVQSPLPNDDGLLQPWAQLMLDPLELMRSSAVLCFDRHRLPQYLLLLDADQRTLTLHGGRTPLCRLELTNGLANSLSPPIVQRAMTCESVETRGEAPKFVKLSHAVANRFTLSCEDGTAFRCAVPLQPHSPRLAAALTATAFLLPEELAQSLSIDAQVWCVRRDCWRASSVDEDDAEWRRFCELIFCLTEQALTIAGDGAVGAPPFKRARVEAKKSTAEAAHTTRSLGDNTGTSLEHGTDCGITPGNATEQIHGESGTTNVCSDWEWLLGSSTHARERLEPRYSSGLATSSTFLPHPPLRRLTESVEASRAGGALHAGTTAAAVPSGTGQSSPSRASVPVASDASSTTSPQSGAVASEQEDVWEGPTVTPPKLLLQHLDSFFLMLHLLYEEWKLHSLHARLLPPLALLLYGLGIRLQCPRFAAFYAQDFPNVRDSATGMAAFGGYGAWLWQVFPRSGGGEREARSMAEARPTAVPQHGDASPAASPASSLQRLREMHVPHLLAACRADALLPHVATGVRAPPYPEVFPLSSVLLSVLRLLRAPPSGSPLLAPRLLRHASRAVARIPGAVDMAGGTPSPLPPFVAPQQAQADAQRARSVRCWLQQCRSQGTPLWEAVLMFLVQHRISRADVALWTLGLAVPVHECLRAAAEQPSSDWLVDSYALIGREDLAMLAAHGSACAAKLGSPAMRLPAAGFGRKDLPCNPNSVGASAGASFGGGPRDLLEGISEPGVDDFLVLSPSPSADPLESSEWLYRMFDRDRRAHEVARILSSSRPATLRVQRRPDQSDHDFEHHKQSRLSLAANRQAALCVGRGAFTLGAVRPLPTELLQAPPLTLAGRFPPQTVVVSLDPSHHSAELNVWAEFSNGVATALQVSEGEELARGWILHHKADATAAAAAGAAQAQGGGQGQGQQGANAGGQIGGGSGGVGGAGGSGGAQAAHTHAGFICGLGLRGMLRVLPVADCYKYLRLQHDTTSVAILIGMAASHAGSMDAGFTRMCCVHVPSMLPATYADLEVASPVQCAAVLGIGLLFARSAHRMMTELLVAEMGRRPSDRSLHDREGYSLAAGFALGVVCLGLGADAPGLADLQLHTWLLRFIHGGPEMPVPGAAARGGDHKQNPNHDPATCSSLVAEPEGINISVTSMAGCVAIALVFLRTNCEAVASRIVIPQNIFQLDYIRPDFAMMRIVARCLIMWDSIEASEAWIDKQLPGFLIQLPQDAAVATAAAAASATPGASAGAQDGNARGASTPPAASLRPGLQRPRAQHPLTPPGAGVVAMDVTPPQQAVFTPTAATPQASAPSLQGMGAATSDAGSAKQIPQWAGDMADVDWLLVGQTKSSIIAGACLAIGLRFAGTGETAAKKVLIARLQEFRDAPRSSAHPALMASLPTPGMELDRSTLETCQSAAAMALGMVMAGTGDLDSLRILRSLRKIADPETSYGVHMASHMAIGFVFLGGGKYTFDQDPLSIATLLMAAFPRFPTSLMDNRCHLQAFRHLYVLAARQRCVEAVDVDTRQPADVTVRLETNRGLEVANLPRLLLGAEAASGGGLKAVTLASERYWPVAIHRVPESPSSVMHSAAGRWMRSLEASRRLYVKRRSGHPPEGSTDDAWFPRFVVPQRRHLERLLQGKTPAPSSGGATSSSNNGRVEENAADELTANGGLELTWLRHDAAKVKFATSAVTPSEWAAALCCEAVDPLPLGVHEFDFEEDDGSICERFAGPLRRAAAVTRPSCQRATTSLTAVVHEKQSSARLAHWLHECVTESKLIAFPMYLLVYLQTKYAAGDCLEPATPRCSGPTAPACSAIAVDHLLAAEWFYRTMRATIGATKRPLMSEDFLTARCATVREVFEEGGRLERLLGAALIAHYGEPGKAIHSAHTVAAEVSLGGARVAPTAGLACQDARAESALVALFSRLHGLAGWFGGIGSLQLPSAGDEDAKVLRALPRLRRALPEASTQGLRRLGMALASMNAQQGTY